jgi:hypothetical protein
VDDDKDSFVEVEVLVTQLHEVFPKAAEWLPDQLVVIVEAVLAQESRNVRLKRKT